ncbi:hypothetical protein LIER_01334 [Lithospermum erythrorhizon]|uniref:Bet v I/Major latex protein domain-containing protein n=1 Tax=Lithospermum erythrorhizon TaxID=34254 RepID=A0AAV3NKK8_LITER
MGLCGKEAKQMQLKCEGNLIFDLIAYCPYELSKLSPQIHGCDLVEGQWGTVGAIIQFTFTVDDKTVFAKERIIALDEENKTIQFETIEGQLLEAYKNCTITVQSSNNSISASLEFEKKNECIPNPTAYLNSFDKFIRDIEPNYQAIPRLATN